MLMGPYTFKRAESDSEFAAIHRLNHQTFVEEIPQHSATESGRLIDKFHAKNTYFVAICDGHVVGMIALHDQPPYSVASRLSDPEILNRPDRRSLEVRLLAVERAHRGGPVMMGLLWCSLDFARHDYSDVYISGVVERVAMYERLGFESLGPPVPDGTAKFVPMRVSFPLPEQVEQLAQKWLARVATQHPH